MPQIGFIRAAISSNFKSAGFSVDRMSTGKFGVSMRRKNEFMDVALVEQHEVWIQERSSAASSAKSQAKTTSGVERMF